MRERIYIHAESTQEAIITLKQQGVETWEIVGSDDSKNIVMIEIETDASCGVLFKELCDAYPHRFVAWGDDKWSQLERDAGR